MLCWLVGSSVAGPAQGRPSHRRRGCLESRVHRRDLGPEGARLRDRARGRGQGDRGARQGLRAQGQAPGLPAGQDPRRGHQASASTDQVLGDVAEAIVNKVVFEEIEGRGLQPLATPKVTDLKIDEGQPMTFRAVFETLPLVEVPEYKGLAGEARRTAKVEDDDVDKELDRLRDENARYDPVEGRPAQTGDFVVRRPRLAARGGRQGRTRRERARRGGRRRQPRGPERGARGDVAGRHAARCASPGPRTTRAARRPDVDYTVTLKAVKAKVVPAADDEFAKDLGEFDSLAALRDAVRAAAARRRGAEDRPRGEGRARRGAGGARELRGARGARRAPHDGAHRERGARARLPGHRPHARSGVDWREYREAQREDSVKAAKADILLDEIARREGIEVLRRRGGRRGGALRASA